MSKTLTRENRSQNRVCPDCENNPIIESNGDVFCDICNRYMEETVLVN